MRFVNTKTLRDRALQLLALQEEIKAMRAELRAKVEEADALEAFIMTKQVDSFQVSDAEGYLVTAQYRHGSRTDIDGDAVRAYFVKIGRKVPMKTSDWTRVRVAYATE